MHESVAQTRGAVPSGVVQPAASTAKSPRDARIDVFRGLALVMIFINHVPGTVFEHFTNRNYGFSDAAEAFVFLSGVAAALAYSSRLHAGPLWPAIARVWARARTLYFVHLSTTTMAMGIMAAAALHFGLPELLTTINLAPIFSHPLGVMIGIPTLGHQLGYFNILPLYTVLLLAAPAMILLGGKRPFLLLGISICVWAAAAQFRLNFPAYPNPGGWFFNPLAWQLLFVLGLLTGMAMKRGARFVPEIGWLKWTAGLFLLAVLIWRLEPEVAAIGRAGLGALYDLGAPYYLVGFDKTFLALPRMLHFLALAYFLSTQGWVERFARSRSMAPFALLGQHGLAVFATGSVLSILMQAIKAGIGDHLTTDALLLGSGLAVQFALAYGLRRTARMKAA
ncbi:OpgC family protein [Pelagibacterium xiamenense]|uniref:OpgC family protein n=1 Tax=Pelagibacterium xiamenense TaxID=2901140 RepID=UPI001E56F412|nr:OpgC domain-containing protein [Pelagibacterium xiamenense]MCD7059150.1 OpgC domain-containing protein [Pelagibacterium xiamenense]